MESVRDFVFTDEDFEDIRNLVRKHTGISLSDAKKNMVYSRLSRRLRQLNLTHFSDYCQLIHSGENAELVNFTNSITTNLTSFFREAHHFDYLKDNALPALLRENRNRKIRIWSTACSTGEEPYSIACILSDALPKNQTWDARILATDLDTNVLKIARSGIYSIDRIENIPRNKIKRWFMKDIRSDSSNIKVRDHIGRFITFKQLNLLGAWPFKGKFDVIFCRNVVIYFDKDTQRILFDRLADVMHDGGLLFIGHSETLYKVTDRFKLLGKTIYKKAY